MHIRGYLKENDISPTAFAAMISVSLPTLYRYFSGDRTPHREVMRRIVAATNGAVQPNDFFEPVAAPAEAEATP